MQLIGDGDRRSTNWDSPHISLPFVQERREVMKNLVRLLLRIAFTFVFGLWLTGVAAAQITYDVANYKALADADSADTIPPGTKITLQNWQQYKKFMPMWVQA